MKKTYEEPVVEVAVIEDIITGDLIRPGSPNIDEIG